MQSPTVSFSPTTENKKRNGKAYRKTAGPTSPTNSVRSSSSHVSGAIREVMSQLDKIQSAQIQFSQKMEKETFRKREIESQIEEARDELRYYRDITKNGNIAKDVEIVKNKMVGKLEYEGAQGRNRLSQLKKENQQMKRDIIEIRQDKLMHLTIYNDLHNSVKKTTSAIKEMKEEINIVNTRKQRREVEISNAKQKIFKEIEEFSRELQNAKKNVNATQASIMTGIKERLEITFSPVWKAPAVKEERVPTPPIDEVAVARQEKMSALLKQVGSSSLEDVIVNLQKSEEDMYHKYHDIQERTEEVDQLDVDNKHLEIELEIQLGTLSELKAASNKLQEELEENISDIHRNIQMYIASYDKNMFVLESCRPALMTIMSSVAIEEDSSDQALIATGVTDRNIPEFLGQIEGRIDELIQMEKAANNHPIAREDFIRPSSATRKSHVTNNMPVLPSFLDEYGEEDATEGEKIAPIDVNLLKNFMSKKLKNSENKSEKEAFEKGGSNKSNMIKAAGSGGNSSNKSGLKKESANTVTTTTGSSESKGDEALDTVPGLPAPTVPAGSPPGSGGRRKRSVVHDTRSHEEKHADMMDARKRIDSGEEATEIRLPTPTSQPVSR